MFQVALDSFSEFEIYVIPEQVATLPDSGHSWNEGMDFPKTYLKWFLQVPDCAGSLSNV